MKVSEAIEHLKKYYKPNDHIVMDIWHTHDVLDISKESDSCKRIAELTTKEAEEIIDYIHNNIDSEYGVTWETIRSSILFYDNYKRR